VWGPHGPEPVGPWGPLVARLMSTVAIVSVATNMNKAVRAEALDLAANHLQSIAKSLKSIEIPAVKGME